MIGTLIVGAAKRYRLHDISPNYASIAARFAASLALLLPFSVAAPAANSVTITLKGYVPAICNMSPPAARGSPPGVLPLNADDLERAGSRQLTFALMCNVPFTFRVEAQNGALVNHQAGAVPRSFTATVPYHIAMRIPMKGATIDEICPSESLREGAATCSFTNDDNTVATNSEGELTVLWASPEAELVAGEYSERITLKIGPRI